MKILDAREACYRNLADDVDLKLATDQTTINKISFCSNETMLKVDYQL